MPNLNLFLYQATRRIGKYIYAIFIHVAAAADSNYSIAGDVSDCLRKCYLRFNRVFQECPPFSVLSDYMTLCVVHVFAECCMDLRILSLWSLLRSTLLDFPFTFCLFCISLIFSHLKSPLSLIHTIIAGPLYSYLIFPLIRTGFCSSALTFFGLHYAVPNNSTAGSMF